MNALNRRGAQRVGEALVALGVQPIARP
jgi:hypothetical protein